MMRSSNYFCLRFLAFLCLAVWCVLVGLVPAPAQAQAQAPRGLSELLGHRMALGDPAARRRVVAGMRRCIPKEMACIAVDLTALDSASWPRML